MMNKGVKFFWGMVVAAVVIIIVVLARTPGEAPTGSGALPEGPIKIGVVLPLTGENASYGLPIQRVGQLAVDELNADGGIAGRPIEVIWEDGKCDPKGGTDAAQKLINIDQVKIIFGGACSGETLAMAPLANEAKVLVISPSATSPDVTVNGGEFVFRTSPSDAAAGAVAAQYAYSKMEARKAAIISETTDYAQGLRRVFKEKFTALSGEVVVDETYQTGSTDFRAQILKIKNSKPDVVYIVPQGSASGVLILKQLKSRGIEAKRLTAEVLIGRDVVSKSKNDMEGLVGIEARFDEQGELAIALFTKYREQYNEEPPYPSFMANMYSQFFLIKEAIEAHGLDTEKIRDWLYSVKDWKHALGSLTFDRNGDPVGLPYSVKKVEGGELKEVEVYRPAAQ